MNDNIRIIPGFSTPSGKRYHATVKLLIKLEKEGALLATTKTVGDTSHRVWYAAPEDKTEREEWLAKVESGEIKSYSPEEFLDNYEKDTTKID